MDELLVEWTIVKCKDYVELQLKNKLGNDFSSLELLHQEFSDENGRIDLIYKNKKDEIILMELETYVDSSKFDFCISQTKRYSKMGPLHFPGKISHLVIFYDSENTSEDYKKKLEVESIKEGIKLVTYKLSEVQVLYEKEVERISKNMGLLLATPKSAMPYTLSSINRFLSAFIITKKSKLTGEEIGKSLPTSKGRNRGKPWSKTSVNEHRYLAEGLGAIECEKVGMITTIKLTSIGQRLIENMNKVGVPFDDMSKISSSIALSPEQKRIILSELMKDNFGYAPNYKSMILLFLRFITISGGGWVPNQRDYSFKEGEMEFLNKILGTNFSNKTNMGNVLTWSRNYCEELELIEIIKTGGKSSKVVLTSIGSRVLNILELTQHIKREIIHIPQQIEI